MEQMALDAGSLLTRLLPEMASRADELRVPRFIDRLRAGARVVWDAYGDQVFRVAQTWESDTARGWAAFAVPLGGGTLETKLQRALVFADDRHFAVREWSWLGVRGLVVADPDRVLTALGQHVNDPSPRVRRFCSELTRPRGVWSAHIAEFKTHPERGSSLLDALHADRDKYVRDSVGNWLNDVAPTRSDWVIDTCARWKAASSADVDYVCRRALRRLSGNVTR